ncbi:hypothetical protein AB6A40_005193 [Gnathostoma spinigerum]|uniref:UBA domain-containing protein n=1 Tax=Gnathostoma spinigerum TaxID=75299 RepID=A0ABD6EME1_9BILA
MVVVNVAGAGRPLQKHVYSLDSVVGDILNSCVVNKEERKVARLMYLGKRLDESLKLCDVKNMKENHSVLLVIPCASNEKQQCQTTLDRKKLEECRRILAKLSTRNFGKLSDELASPDCLSRLFAHVPALKYDRAASLVVTDYVLLMSYILPDQPDERFINEHPVLVDAVHHLLQSTTSAMSQSSSSASISDRFPAVESAPSASSSQGVITPQMLQEAMQQVLRNMEAGGSRQSPSAFPGSTASRSSTTSLEATAADNFASGGSEPRYLQQCAQLIDYGFTDETENLRALEETEGNVEQAVEILMAIRESLSHQ